MALKKKITNNKGLITEYYRVGESRFDANNGVATVSIFGYADASYREKEKQAIKIRHELDRIYRRVDEIMTSAGNADSLPTSEEMELVELRARERELLPQRDNDTYYLSQEMFTLPFTPDGDMNTATLYNELKKQEYFNGAEDC